MGGSDVHVGRGVGSALMASLGMQWLTRSIWNLATPDIEGFLLKPSISKLISREVCFNIVL
jgi:hypothetical protein